MPDLHPSWPAPSSGLLLPASEIHIWQALLDMPTDLLAHLKKSLSADEVARAERFQFQQHREHFIVARGILRDILSRYLHCTPDTIRFSYNSFGKPAIQVFPQEDTIAFNLSHSNGVALYVFQRGGDIGIDVERLDKPIDLLQAGALVFSPAEMLALRALSPALQRTVFFQYWTRKESFIKALGKGFSLPLHLIDVSQASLEPVLQADYPEAPFGRTDWYVWDFIPRSRYAAAVAAKGKDWQFSFYQYEQGA